MKKHLAALFLLSLAVLAAYSSSINGSWALDDFLANRPVGINHLRDLLGFRKITYLTFLFNQWLAAFSPANFRLFNIAVHIFNVSFVYLLAWKTTRLSLGNPGKTGNTFVTVERKAFYAAVISGAVFGLHPLNINAVAYIVQRMTSLASLFVLLALISYILAAQTEYRLKRFLMYTLSGSSIVLGIFSKENAVMAVPLILLYDYVFISGNNYKRFLRKMAGIAGIFIMLIAPVSWFLKFHLTFINIAQMLLNFNQPVKAAVWTAVDVYWTPFQHILTEFRVVARYLFLVLFPLPQFLVFDWWGFPVSEGFMEPVTTLLSAVILLSLLVFSIWKIKRFPMLCFGILWYFLAISLESFIAVGSDLYFEYRNYLPLTGLLPGIIGQLTLLINGESIGSSHSGLSGIGGSVRPTVGWFRSALNKKDSGYPNIGHKQAGMTVSRHLGIFYEITNSKILWIAGVSLCLILGSLTFTRNYVWKDSVVLWGDTVKKTQGNLRALVALGSAYVKQSDFVTATKIYEDAVEASEKAGAPFFLSEALRNLGMAELFLGDITSAMKTITLMERKSADNNKTDILRGFYSSLSGDHEKALTILYTTLSGTGDLDRVVVYTLIGDTYRRKGLTEEAINNYREALKLDPVFSAAYYGIGSSYLRAGKPEEALENLKKTLALDPNNVLALSDMADIMLIRKEPVARAYEYANRAVSLSPSFYQPYLMMGNVLLVKGEEGAAEGFYKKASEHRAADYRIAFNKSRAWYLKGDREKAIYYLESCLAIENLPPDFKRTAQQGLKELKERY